MVIEPRSSYKSVWTNLSGTYQQAVHHVIGDVDEATIQSTAESTKYWLEQTVGVNPDDVILEIGCGVGRVGQALAPACKEWIGCDVSPNMLAHARQRLASFENVRLVEISGFDLQPIPDASVDLVYCTVVFMHLDEWDRYKYIVEALRVLKPGGRIFVDNFNLDSDGGWEIFQNTRRQMMPQHRPPHISKSSTLQEIEVYLRRANFERIESVPNGSWVQGWGWKPAGDGPAALLAAEAAIESQAQANAAGLAAQIMAQPREQQSPAVVLLNQRVAELEGYIATLEAGLRVKNEHIRRLELLIERISNGRVMRLLSWATRRRG